jgi:hypothetical protein
MRLCCAAHIRSDTTSKLSIPNFEDDHHYAGFSFALLLALSEEPHATPAVAFHDQQGQR